MNDSTTLPKIVVIGGGTGNFTLLQALKKQKCELTALVNMADDGGSTGVLRDELGVLPPGDVRQCLVALSDAPEELRQLFSYRFPEGSFAGHSFGNLFLSAVEKMTDNFSDAVRVAGDVLRIRGRVLPVTLENCKLVLEQDGQQIIGQHTVEQTAIKAGAHPKLSLQPEADLLPEAAQAIAEADLVVIAPGNLYASLAPALLVKGMATALQTTPAQVAFVCNLVNKPHHTPDYDVHAYVEAIEHLIGKDVVDYVLYNTDTPTEALLKKYALEGEYPVIIYDNRLSGRSYQAIPGAYLSHARQTPNKHDTLLKRSLMRHDARSVAKSLMMLLNQNV